MRFSSPIGITLICCLFSFYSSVAQPAKKEWAKNYGGTENDIITFVFQDKDGNYIFSGHSNSSDSDLTSNNGSYDAWIAKANDTGKVLWSKNYGGSGDEVIWHSCATKDGGYILAGSTDSYNGDVVNRHPGGMEVWIIKVDENGNKEWQKTYGGSGDESACSIQQTKDGGYIFTGWASSNDGDLTSSHVGLPGGFSQDLWVVKIDSTGKLIWQKDLGGSNSDIGFSVLQSEDGNYIVAGYTASNDGDIPMHYGNSGKWDAWVLKFNATGTLLWQKFYGGTQDDAFNAIVQTPDKGYILAGATNSNDSDVSGNHLNSSLSTTTDVWVAKIDSLGNLNWQKCYGGSGTETAVDIKQTQNGGYVLAASTTSVDGDVTGNHDPLGIKSDYWVVQLRSSGELDWEETFGGSSSDALFSIISTSDNGYMLAGRTTSEDGDVTKWYSDKNDGWLVKLSAPLSISSFKAVKHIITIFPNPSQTKFTIQYHFPANENAIVEITDVTGRAISTIPLPKNTTQTTINAATWQPGIYFYKVLQNGNTLQTGKLLKQ